MKPYVASHHLDTCSWEVWRKSIQGKWQKWRVSHVTKKQRLCDPFFALSPKPIARFRWKRASLSLFRPEPHLPSFIQIHQSFRDLLAKTTWSPIIKVSTLLFPKQNRANTTKIYTKSCKNDDRIFLLRKPRAADGE